MKAISINNPYATQIMQGSKTIEYRSWDTKYRGDLLICSSANPIIPGMLSGHALCIVNLANTAYDSTEDMDAVYENFVRQIAGPDLGQAAAGETSLKDSIEIQKQREQLQKQIAMLEAKIRKEKQPKKKFEMVKELKNLQGGTTNGQTENAQP